MNCAYCKHTDGVVYTSLPPKYKCAITGEYHLALDDCNVEFAPVKHGRWVHKFGDGHTGGAITGGECSICGYVHTATPYCPNCGARMDEVEE